MSLGTTPREFDAAAITNGSALGGPVALLGMYALRPGTIFADEYRVIGPLSEGGMGAVYAVEQASTGKKRALKTMHVRLVHDPMLRERFRQESRVGSLIASEHVVEVIAAGVDHESGMPWLVMELLEGEDLATYASRVGALTPTEVVPLLDQLCHALGAAHDAGIVHRDLKPENVYLCRSNRADVSFTVKVLDFGIAKVLSLGGATSTAAIGTPLWMAPEQAGAEGKICPATDVWALGLMVFRLLSGRPYWLSAQTIDLNAANLLREVLLDAVHPASQRSNQIGGASLDPRLDAWFSRCLTRDPAQRIPDARRAWADLRPVLSNASKEIGFAATVASTTVEERVATPPQEDEHPMVSGSPLTRVSRSVRIVLGVLGLLAVVGAATAGRAMWLHGQQTSATELGTVVAVDSNSRATNSASPSLMGELAPNSVRKNAAMETSACTQLRKRGAAVSETSSERTELFRRALDHCRKAESLWAIVAKKHHGEVDIEDRFWLAHARHEVVWLRVALGETLTEVDWSRAQQAAVAVRDSENAGQRLEPAAFYAVDLAFLQVEQDQLSYRQSRGKRGLEPRSGPKQRNENGKVVIEREPLPAAIRAWNIAQQEYIDRVPFDKDIWHRSVIFEFQIGVSYYDYGQLDIAASRLTPVYEKHCWQHVEGFEAWRRLVDIARWTADQDRLESLLSSARARTCARTDEQRVTEREILGSKVALP